MKQSVMEYQQKLRSYSRPTIEKISRFLISLEMNRKCREAIMETDTEEELVKILDELLKEIPENSKHPIS